MAGGTLTDALRQLIEALKPDLRAFSRPSRLGKVVAVDTANYRVDVVIGGNETDDTLALSSVPVSALFAQDGYGVWALPEEGAEVTVSFHDGDVTQPYVEAPIYFRNLAPDGEYATGTIAIRGKMGQELILDPGTDKVTIKTAKVLIGTEAPGDSAAVAGLVFAELQAIQSHLGSLKTALELHTHTCAAPGSPSAPPSGPFPTVPTPGSVASSYLKVPEEGE